MRLRVVNRTALSAIMQAIVNAAHTSTDTAGVLIKDGTLDGEKLQTAARMAVEMVTGDLVLPHGEKLIAPQPKPAPSIIETTAA